MHWILVPFAGIAALAVLPFYAATCGLCCMGLVIQAALKALSEAILYLSDIVMWVTWTPFQGARWAEDKIRTLYDRAARRRR